MELDPPHSRVFVVCGRAIEVKQGRHGHPRHAEKARTRRAGQAARRLRRARLPAPPALLPLVASLPSAMCLIAPAPPLLPAAGRGAPGRLRAVRQHPERQNG
eukprot:364231-Chlamydomonas_euryale.AAC.4